MAKYRKLPVEIDAVQLLATEPGDDLTFDEITEWLAQALLDGVLVRVPGDSVNGGDWDFLRVTTLEGDHLIGPGYFILRGVAGELYGCEPEIFRKTYERVEDDAVAG